MNRLQVIGQFSYLRDSPCTGKPWFPWENDLQMVGWCLMVQSKYNTVKEWSRSGFTKKLG